MEKIKSFDEEKSLYHGVTLENGLKPRGAVSGDSYWFPSTYDIGQRVQLMEYKEKYYVRAIILTNSKIRYSLFLDDVITDEEGAHNIKTTLHNIDSAMVLKGFDERIDFEEDNYS